MGEVSMTEPAEVPRGFRRWWVEPFRRTDDSAWPFIHSAGIKGRFRHRFFSVSFGWGTKKVKSW